MLPKKFEYEANSEILPAQETNQEKQRTDPQYAQQLRISRKNTTYLYHIKKMRL